MEDLQSLPAAFFEGKCTDLDFLECPAVVSLQEKKCSTCQHMFPLDGFEGKKKTCNICLNKKKAAIASKKQKVMHTEAHTIALQSQLQHMQQANQLLVAHLQGLDPCMTHTVPADESAEHKGTPDSDLNVSQYETGTPSPSETRNPSLVLSDGSDEHCASSDQRSSTTCSAENHSSDLSNTLASSDISQDQDCERTSDIHMIQTLRWLQDDSNNQDFFTNIDFTSAVDDIASDYIDQQGNHGAFTSIDPLVEPWAIADQHPNTDDTTPRKRCSSCRNTDLKTVFDGNKTTCRYCLDKKKRKRAEKRVEEDKNEVNNSELQQQIQRAAEFNAILVHHMARVHVPSMPLHNIIEHGINPLSSIPFNDINHGHVLVPAQSMHVQTSDPVEGPGTGSGSWMGCGCTHLEVILNRYAWGCLLLVCPLKLVIVFWEIGTAMFMAGVPWDTSDEVASPDPTIAMKLTRVSHSLFFVGSIGQFIFLALLLANDRLPTLKGMMNRYIFILCLGFFIVTSSGVFFKFENKVGFIGAILVCGGFPGGITAVMAYTLKTVNWSRRKILALVILDCLLGPILKVLSLIVTAASADAQHRACGEVVPQAHQAMSVFVGCEHQNALMAFTTFYFFVTVNAWAIAIYYIYDLYTKSIRAIDDFGLCCVTELIMSSKKEMDMDSDCDEGDLECGSGAKERSAATVMHVHSVRSEHEDSSSGTSRQEKAPQV